MKKVNLIRGYKKYSVEFLGEEKTLKGEERVASVEKTGDVQEKDHDCKWCHRSKGVVP